MAQFSDNPFGGKMGTLEVPTAFRQMAEKGVTQARETYEKLKEAAESTNGALESFYDKIAGIPESSYVQRILASQHSVGTVYALFNNHQNGDFKPYIVKSTDPGKTWTSIASNLPARGSTYAIRGKIT